MRATTAAQLFCAVVFHLFVSVFVFTFEVLT